MTTNIMNVCIENVSIYAFEQGRILGSGVLRY